MHRNVLGGLCIKRKIETCHEDSCHLVKALLFRLPLEKVTMGGSKKIFILMYVLAALIELGFGNICRNPQAYEGQNVADRNGGFRGECVSFYKVTISFYQLQYFVGHLFETLMMILKK